MEEDRELSSGAEKVENLASKTPEERERLMADARVEAAKERERAALKQAQEQEEAKRLKERQKKERLAESARRREAKERERTEKAEAREQRREERANKRRRGSGVGGWIAAVVSLGLACLTLATVVTVGAVRMNELEARFENTAREAVYEMAEASEAMDASLTKLRVSEGRSEQRRLLTEVAVGAALLESALEKLPCRRKLLCAFPILSITRGCMRGRSSNG